MLVDCEKTEALLHFRYHFPWVRKIPCHRRTLFLCCLVSLPRSLMFVLSKTFKQPIRSRRMIKNQIVNLLSSTVSMYSEVYEKQPRLASLGLSFCMSRDLHLDLCFCLCVGAVMCRNTLNATNYNESSNRHEAFQQSYYVAAAYRSGDVCRDAGVAMAA
jgi:hypothetical protein